MNVMSRTYRLARVFYFGKWNLLGRTRPARQRVPDVSRSTNPDSMMDLHLRFTVPTGTRSLIVRNIQNRFASEIKAAMIAAGHDAEFVDSCSSRSLAVRMKAHKKRSAKAKPVHKPDAATNIVKIGRTRA